LTARSGRADVAFQTPLTDRMREVHTRGRVIAATW
jgi:hypothetical protein